MIFENFSNYENIESENRKRKDSKNVFLFFLFTFVFTLKGYFDMDDVKGVDYNGRYLFKLRNLLERLSRERESPFDVRK